MNNLVDFYFERLDFHRDRLKLKGYTKTIFELAQKDIKEFEKGVNLRNAK